MGTHMDAGSAQKGDTVWHCNCPCTVTGVSDTFDNPKTGSRQITLTLESNEAAVAANFDVTFRLEFAPKGNK